MRPLSRQIKTLLFLIILGHVIVIWVPLLFASGFASDLDLFFGRFHPSIVHLPIGVLLAAIGLQIARIKGWLTDAGSAVDLLLYAGAWSAIVACGSGILLAGGGGYDANTLFWHRAIGIGIATLATGGWVFSVTDGTSKARLATGGILVAGLVIGGHLGGDLTHHEGYLTRYLPDQIRRTVGLPPAGDIGKLEIEDPSVATVYDWVVQPILNRRCVACHNDETSRGSLSLASYESLLSGGGDGPAILAGAAAESPIIQRIWLPPDHPDHMPPPGRPQISVAEAEILRWWIENGASSEGTIEKMQVSSEIQNIFTAYGLGEQKTGIFALSLPMPDTSAVSIARETGLTISYLAQDLPFLEVTCARARACLGDEQTAAMLPLTEYVAHFNAAENALSDDALQLISQFENLTHVRLEKTDITDDGLGRLSALEFLEVLNVYGTRVTDEGLNQLIDLPALQTVYAWKTSVTPEGVDALRRSKPGLEIDLGSTETDPEIGGPSKE